MVNTTVLWAGPVTLSQVRGATVPGARELTLPCAGDGCPSCAQIAESWTDKEGRKLPGLLRSRQIDESAVGDLVLGAFSAGGSVLKRLLLHEADRARVRAVLLADGAYCGWTSPRSPEAPEGFVRFCLDALRERKLFVATASSAPNKALPTGSETLGSIRREVEKRSGLAFERAALLETDPQPVEVWRLGNVVLADYQTTVPHAAHATRLAAPIWQKVLLPWLERESALDYASLDTCPLAT